MVVVFRLAERGVEDVRQNAEQLFCGFSQGCSQMADGILLAGVLFNASYRAKELFVEGRCYHYRPAVWDFYSQ